jgi:hypothetical protein
MSQAHLTLSAVEAAVKTAAREDRRKHLGASIIGRSCARQIWYMFRWAKKEDFEARMLRLFGRGHKEENAFILLLQNAGIKVWEVNEKNKHEYRVSYSDGHGGGTPDGVLRGVPDIPAGEFCLAEYKTHNEKSFNKLLEDGLVKAKYTHFVQMQIYMCMMGLSYGLYCAVCKNDDRLFFEVVRCDPQVGNRFIHRTEQIVNTQVPPPKINQSPGWWECKFCTFLDICHHHGDVDKNCRTCDFGSVGPNSTWLCEKGHVEIAEQQGCGEWELLEILNDIPF